MDELIRQGKAGESLKALELGVMPTTKNLSQKETTGLPLDQFNQWAAPGGVMQEGGMPQTPLRPDTYDLPGLGTVSMAPGGVGTNAAKVNKIKMDLRWKAQAEANRRLGGTAFVGLSEKRRAEYVKLSEELYEQYLTEYANQTGLQLGAAGDTMTGGGDLNLGVGTDIGEINW